MVKQMAGWAVAQRVLFAVTLMTIAAPSVSAWYLPGSAPRTYTKGEAVPFSVNALEPMAMAPGNPNTRLPAPSGAGTGSNAHIKSIINLDYYNEHLHFCQPKGGPQGKSEGLGSVLFGDRIYNSPIEPRMLVNESCVQVCTTDIPSEDAKYINEKIEDQYAVRWLVDGLPVATKKIADRTHEFSTLLAFH
ncbi:hypothetical protein L7F22_042288 [Adiantum nelumboides]|nr:hypothetical protein [Adiantum nelumboides]